MPPFGRVCNVLRLAYEEIIWSALRNIVPDTEKGAHAFGGFRNEARVIHPHHDLFEEGTVKQSPCRRRIGNHDTVVEIFLGGGAHQGEHALDDIGFVLDPDRAPDSAAFITCTGSYTTTQADLDAGSVMNSATVSGVAPCPRMFWA